MEFERGRLYHLKKTDDSYFESLKKGEFKIWSLGFVYIPSIEEDFNDSAIIFVKEATLEQREDYIIKDCVRIDLNVIKEIDEKELEKKVKIYYTQYSFLKYIPHKYFWECEDFLALQAHENILEHKYKKEKEWYYFNFGKKKGEVKYLPPEEKENMDEKEVNKLMGCLNKALDNYCMATA